MSMMRCAEHEINIYNIYNFNNRNQMILILR